MSQVTIMWLGAVGLLVVGLFGLLTVRNLLQVIIALQLLGKAAVLALVAAGRSSGHINLGQSLAATVIVADTVVAVIGLALAIQVKRRVGTLDLKALATLRS
ncbi:MAG: NADH-quinone oxidoreductase subunit K [Candidatus Promineifilaceae bacterium]